MKRSAQVPAAMVASLATALIAAGCSSRCKDCIDSRGVIVSDSYCRNPIYGARWVNRDCYNSGGFGGSGYSYGG